MGATNTTTSNKKYYKLKEDKRDGSATKGQNRFFEQAKQPDGKWGNGDEFNSMSGTLKAINLKSYEYEGKPKETIELELLDDADNETICVVSLGFKTFITENILNSLASEPMIGLLEFSCGAPKDGYPTFYIKHNGQKTKWKYSKENNNWTDVPVITKTQDDEGNDIIKGQKARTEFWKKVLTEQVLPKLAPLSQPITNTVIQATNDGVANTETSNENLDLPF